MCGVLQWDHATLHGARPDRAGKGGNREGEMISAAVPADTSPGLGRPIQPSFLLQYPLGSVGGVLLSYLCVAMVFAVGVVASWRWGPADDPKQLVRDVVVAPPRPVGASVPMIVGQITAMRDCRWIAPETIRVGDPVPDGRVFVMASGRLEISYSSGARVTLEGPVAYVVNRLNGGSLFLGKLTAEAGKIDRAALAEGERARNHPAPTPGAVAFCVRTQSASVFDNGNQDGKFAVEVDASSATYTHVLQGSITLEAPGLPVRSFASGESVWTGAGAGHQGLFVFRPGPNAAIFVQETPQPPPVCEAKPGADKRGQNVKGGG